MKNLLIFIILFFVEGSYCQIDKKINPHEEDIYVLYHDKSIPRWVEVLPMKTIPEDKLGLNFSNELSSYMLVEKK